MSNKKKLIGKYVAVLAVIASIIYIPMFIVEWYYGFDVIAIATNKDNARDVWNLKSHWYTRGTPELRRYEILGGINFDNILRAYGIKNGMLQKIKDSYNAVYDVDKAPQKTVVDVQGVFTNDNKIKTLDFISVKPKNGTKYVLKIVSSANFFVNRVRDDIYLDVETISYSYEKPLSEQLQGIGIEKNMATHVQQALKKIADPKMKDKKQDFMHIFPENADIVVRIIKDASKNAVIKVNSLFFWDKGKNIIYFVASKDEGFIAHKYKPEEYVNSLKNDENINFQDEYGITTLMRAAKFVGDVEFVKNILDEGADISVVDWEGLTALHYAAANSNPDIVSLLVDRGANINSRDIYGYSPLVYALLFGDIKMVKTFMSSGADIAEKNNVGIPLLMAAIQSEEASLDKIKLLLENHDFDVNQAVSGAPSPFIYAIFRNKNAEVLDELINYGADVNKDCNGVFPLLALIEPKIFNAKNLELLLENGADMSVTDDGGNTALHYASEGNIEALDILLKHEKVNNADNVNVVNNKGDTALNVAVFHKCFECARLLLDNGADINVKNNLGISALHYAVILGNSDIVKLLLDYGADIYAKTNIGKTAFDYAEKTRNSDIKKWLINKEKEIRISEIEDFCNNGGLNEGIVTRQYNKAEFCKCVANVGVEAQYDHRAKGFYQQDYDERQLLAVAVYCMRLQQRKISSEQLLEALRNEY